MPSLPVPSPTGAMLRSNGFAMLLLVICIGLLGWTAYDHFANPYIDASNCGVTVAPATVPAIVPAFASNRVPLKLVNRSGRPIQIVGNNAC